MFELLDIKWGDAVYGTPSGEINWTADLGGLSTTAGVSEADLDAALQAAFDAWESVAAIDFVENNSSPDVTVTYAPLGVSPGATIAGIASWGPNIVGSLNSLEVGIIRFNSDLTWSDDGSGGIDFFAIALHEIGHIIGLDHVPDDTQIMNAIVFEDSLGAGDIDGAQFIYGTEGGISGGSDGGGGGSAGGAIALLLGLLALLAGLFTGGGGGTVAMAAFGMAPDDADGDADGENALDYLPGLPLEELEIAGLVSHPVYVILDDDGTAFPMVEYDCQPKACGCFGQCLHEDLDDEDQFDWA